MPAKCKNTHTHTQHEPDAFVDHFAEIKQFGGQRAVSLAQGHFKKRARNASRRLLDKVRVARQRRDVDGGVGDVALQQQVGLGHAVVDPGLALLDLVGREILLEF